MIILLKPNYLIARFNCNINQNLCSINLLGLNKNIKRNDILLAKLPIYKQKQQL